MDDTPVDDTPVDHTPMEPQHFVLKRWLKTLQLVSSAMLMVFGSANVFGGGNALLGVFFMLFALYSLGQSIYAGVVATEEGLQVRFNITKPKFHAWEDIDYATSGRPMMLRLVDGNVARLPPYLDDADELKWMIDDTVGPAPA